MRCGKVGSDMDRRTAKQVACMQAAWRLSSALGSGSFGADNLSDADNERILDAINDLIDELARRSGEWWEWKRKELEATPDQKGETQ